MEVLQKQIEKCMIKHIQNILSKMVNVDINFLLFISMKNKCTIKDNGKINYHMEKGQYIIKMVYIIRDFFYMAKHLQKMASLYLMMGPIIEGRFTTQFQMGKEDFSPNMAYYMKVHGKIISLKGTENKLLMMEIHMLVILSMG